MSKSLIVRLFSIAGLALLAACGSRQTTPVVVVPPAAPPAPVVTAPANPVTVMPANPAPAVVQPVASIRPGMGRIESMAPASASAGASAPGNMQRLNIRMDDGSMQVIDTPSPGFSVGDRIELTREGFIRRFPA